MKNFFAFILVLCTFDLPQAKLICGWTTEVSARCYPHPKALTKKYLIHHGCKPANNSLPWMVHIMIADPTGPRYASGFIVSQYHILTAAHVMKQPFGTSGRFYEVQPKDTTLYFGGLSVDQFIRGQGSKRSGRSGIHHIRTHWAYDGKELLTNDIAIIELVEPLTWSAAIQPICLRTDPPMTSSNIQIAGWGDHDAAGFNDNSLQQAELKVQSEHNCIRKCLVQNMTMRQIGAHFCALDETYGSAAGTGDSGGPAMTQVNNVWHAVGILTGVIPGRPCGVFTSVSLHCMWINREVRRKLGQTICN